jgi:hypothetical protein
MSDVSKRSDLLQLRDYKTTKSFLLKKYRIAHGPQHGYIYLKYNNKKKKKIKS